MSKAFKYLITIFFTVSLQSCGGGSGSHNPVTEPEEPFEGIVDIAKANGSFTTLVSALETAGLDETLNDANALFTVFAPTDDAFEILGDDIISALLADTEKLSDVLLYHVINGEVDSSTAIASAGMTVEMANGKSIGVSLNSDELLINVATVTSADIEADNGIIHVIDAVLNPPVDRGSPTSNLVDTAIEAGSFDTLISVLQATGLDTVLADETQKFTVFAPTDAAFAMIDPETINLLLENPDTLAEILLQHVVTSEVSSPVAYALNGTSALTASGAEIPISIDTEIDTLNFGGATVTARDIYASNGVIHVLDTVVVADVQLPTPLGSLSDVASGNDKFTTLVSALQATGLDTVLDDPEGSFTVFAPTDEAFASVDPSVLIPILADPVAMENLLLYHVYPGTVLQDQAQSIANSDTNIVTMVNGDTAAFSIGSDSNLYINKSRVSLTDVVADNGVIHVVDQVILNSTSAGPRSNSIAEIASASEDFSTLTTALSIADLVDTLSNESETFTVFAPTNAAFDKIPDDTLDAILADTETLTSILLKHVVIGSEIDAVSAFAANGGSVTHAGDDTLQIQIINYSLATNPQNASVAYDKENQILVGGNGSFKPGFTLYTFDDDLGSSGSNCNGECANVWPPVISDEKVIDNISGLGEVVRNDGSMQTTFKGRPLYFYSGDNEIGEFSGEGVAGTWSVVRQQQTALEIQDSEVIAENVIATNGIIHVIDTVITE